MARESRPVSSVFSINVTSAGASEVPAKNSDMNDVCDLLKQMLIGQERQNELLEDLVEQINSGQKQRASELGQWKEANPQLARRCRAAAEALSQVQTEFLENLTLEINENMDGLMDGEFMLNEFVDRFGPRLAHLNGVLQVLAQLSAPHNQTTTH
jgi:putative heme iron utilization protein